MARIRLRRGNYGTRVLISGQLRAADMGRLENACGSALATQPLRLEIDLRRVTAVDRTATAVLARLCGRGAVVHSPTDASI